MIKLPVFKIKAIVEDLYGEEQEVELTLSASAHFSTGRQHGGNIGEITFKFEAKPGMQFWEEEPGRDV